MRCGNLSLAIISFFAIPFFFAIYPNSVFSQGIVGAPFLQSEPSAYSLGMAGADAALRSDDPFAMYSNPAANSFFGVGNNVSFGISPFLSENYPGWVADVDFRNFAVRAGYDLSSQAGFPLKIGAGFMRQHADLGKFIRTDLTGKVIGEYESEEYANSFNVSASTRYFIDIGLGITYKHIGSRLAPSSGSTQTKANAGAFDIGIFAGIPVFEDLKFGEKTKNNLYFNLAWVLANVGSSLDYEDGADPLPRMARIGLGMEFNIEHQFAKHKFELVELKAALQADDLLVSRDSLEYEYQSAPFGDIDLVEDLLLQKRTEVTSGAGFTISALESIRFSYGLLSNKLYYDDFLESIGFGFRLKGLFKLLDGMAESGFTEFLSNHIDIVFNYVEINSSKRISATEDMFGLSIRYHGFEF